MKHVQTRIDSIEKRITEIKNNNELPLRILALLTIEGYRYGAKEIERESITWQEWRSYRARMLAFERTEDKIALEKELDELEEKIRQNSGFSDINEEEPNGNSI